ncbi:MAG: homoserine dehydrogenase [Lactobacillales bacterium]|jgi:homoserine dehydrogenase|nr:homoserine dehydrogenase [Lactobacillales bacterium]
MSKRTLKVAVLGLGTVGFGVPAILQEQKDKIEQTTEMKIVIAKALVRDVEVKKALAQKYHFQLVPDIKDIVQDPEIDVVVELIGGIEQARVFIKEALNACKHVVSANKDLIATYGEELTTLAKKQNVNFYYEAAVAGGIPILRTLSSSLSADGIYEVLGIVNGTTNHMLTQMMQKGATYDEALTSAQKLGFAEANPTNDVDGIDAAYKMVILSDFAYGMKISLDDIKIQGIRMLQSQDVKIADSLDYVFKLIGYSRKFDEGIDVAVAPALVHKNHQLANVNNEMNAVFVKSAEIGESMYYGPGAGSLPTAASVVADLIAIAQNVQHEVLGIPFNTYKKAKKLATDSQIRNQYYFHFEVLDGKKQFEQLKSLFAKAQIKIKQMIDYDPQVVVLTYAASAKRKKQFLKSIESTPGFELISVYNIFD